MSRSKITENVETSFLAASREPKVDAEDAGWERRIGKRFAVSDRAVVRRNGESEDNVELVDVSEEGAGIWSTTILVPGEEVEVVLRGRRWERLVVDAVVVDRKVVRGGVWRLSLRFRQRLRPEELVAILD